MIHTKHLSVLAIMLCVSTQAFGVRVAHPALKRELQAYFAQHSDSLSKHACTVQECIAQGKDVDKETLIQTIREAQNHGFSVRKHQNPLLARTRTQQLH